MRKVKGSLFGLGLVVFGRCGHDAKRCDGESLICRLNPSEVNPIFRDLGESVARPFFNRQCSSFKKVFK